MGKPEIRFKGYTDEWEQRKLGDVAQEFKSGNSLKADEIDITGDYPVYGGNGLRGYTSNYNHDGEYALIGRQGALCGNMNYSVGKAYFTEHAVVVKAGENNDTKFLYYMLDTMNLGQYSDQSAQPGLAVNKLVKLENRFPTKEEQQRIGWYFSNIDNLITLHQRKCDEVKSLKKYMLQKMFPQNEQKVPEIRFEGFTEAWEQRKLGDVFKEYSEKNHTELPALTIIQGGGTVKREESDRNLMYDESNLSNYKMVRKNDFIVHLRSFEGGLEKSSLDGIISPAYHTFHSDVADSRFYYPYFRSHEFIKHKLVPHVYGIRDGRSIDITGMKTIEIPYTSMEEQRKIGDYLESLDHLITLHQQKCEELKKIKKFMLQKMFV